VEVNVLNWGTISDGLVSYDSLAGTADSESEMAEFSESNSQNNIDDIITRSSSVGISSGITFNNSKSVL